MSETVYEIAPWLLWIADRKLQVADRSMLVASWKVGREGSFSPAVRTFWPRMTDSGMVTRGEGLFLGSSMPHPKGAQSQHPQNFWTPTKAVTVWPTAPNFGIVTREWRPSVLRGRAQHLQSFWYHLHAWHSMTSSNKILHSDQTRQEDIFTRSTMPSALDENFCDTNADVRSVCGN